MVLFLEKIFVVLLESSGAFRVILVPAQFHSGMVQSTRHFRGVECVVRRDLSRDLFWLVWKFKLVRYYIEVQADVGQFKFKVLVFFDDTLGRLSAVAVHYSIEVVHLLHLILAQLSHILAIIVFIEGKVLV